MKREIKFRVWDGIDYMSKPFDLFDLQDRSIQFTTDAIIMQFTGLLDRNNKEIYEGDIVKIHEGNYPLNWWVEYNIEWQMNASKGSFVLKWMRDINDTSPTIKSMQRTNIMEVIGNIYENLDLLK